MNYKLSLLLFFIVSVCNSSELGSRVVEFEYNDEYLKLYTYKTRSDLATERKKDTDGVITSIHDKFNLGTREFFVGSELMTIPNEIFRKGIFQVVEGETVLLVGPGDGFSLNYKGQKIVFLHNAFANKSRIMESRVFHFRELSRDGLSIDLLATMNGLTVMDAIVINQNILVSGYCDGAEFAFEMSFDGDLNPKLIRILSPREQKRSYKGDCDQYIRNFLQSRSILDS